jgi:hypothetical protein
MHCPRKPRARLTESEAISIYALKDISSATSVGRLYGMSEKAIRDIWTARTWANETWHLDMARALVIKQTGRPTGTRDAKPRRKQFASFQVPATQKDEVQVKHRLSDRVEEPEYTGIASICSVIHKRLSFDCVSMSVDDQLFAWEQTQSGTSCCDPFMLDWKHMSLST